ncbi:MAG: hypothetical protein MPEBLZ_03317 [Candidatus Methanoperedens nitroreducens]|uniref:Uncharacterized protein n=1 Tax=Candidatus Methanoperedens nitratireducens TaxID=1392998 RepID=A0A0P7ZF59_9EURY|nr:hypothetical protein [Candidatus Methanoperedens sp. BLZ2]KAB2944606.1 MAG: hypothetical protein F9K14_14040 [Candidatus Methanoperedens sp.]KPQ42145.1 MAG: hypothetical protein MPEBLZ_03317 [Candidatus Methanoperedens sp. BLZ1]MBZ0176873.1 hypothetical protein [Candidatus Methanoperedens nitroreducens]CAG0986311.1 hypothetical protein METP2_02297 [Methanosarcinales archaeon]MCX9077105.1 hypothetical protein [Candidatus Methanoperedens sp.]
MVIVHPYITDTFVSYKGDTIITRLSLAVLLEDDYTGEEPVGYVEVMYREGNQKAIKNLSGYYTFTDMAAGNNTVSVRSKMYYSLELSVNPFLLDPKDPVLEILLKPLPSYPFPANATLVRGLLSNPDMNLTGNVNIKAIEPGIETISDNMGEFVLYFRDVKNKKITIELKKNGASKTVETNLDEGKTISLGKIAFP